MANQISFYYQQYVTTMMSIDMDDNGLYCQVPSESSGESYTVRCTEHHDHVEVKSCSCMGFRRWSHCKHSEIIQNWWNKIYASNIVKANEKALEQAIDAAEAMYEAEEMVAIAEEIIISTKESDTFERDIPQQAPVVSGTKKCKRLDYRSAQTLAFFSGLPSRQPAA